MLRYLRAREPRRADDLAGETWLAVAGRIAAVQGDEADFASWLFTIARRRLADLRRTGARRRTDPFADVPDGELDGSTEDQALAELGAEDAVARIVRLLTPAQAEVVLLRTLGGLSARHVGEVMDVRRRGSG